MSIVLLAVGDVLLRRACARQLSHAGHTVLEVDRPLVLLSLPERVTWDTICVDDSPLGRACLATLDGVEKRRVVGLGVDTARVDISVALPLADSALVDAVSTTRQRSGTELRLDAANRVVASNGARAVLTRTEFRLLEVLLDRQPQEVALDDVLESVWGFTEGRATSELVRAHVRNLRAKLAQIGLPDAVRSRRGRGYALVLP